MRTLKQEIAYQRANGFQGNTIELGTLLSWLGEITALEYEIQAERDKNRDLRFSNHNLLNAIEGKERDLQRLAEQLTPNEKVEEPGAGLCARSPRTAG